MFVLPGRVEDAVAAGGLRLIQDGAGIAIAPADLFHALLLEAGSEVSDDLRKRLAAEWRQSARDAPPSRTSFDGPFADPLRELFREADAWYPDALVERIPSDVPSLLRELSRLEATGVLRRTANGQYVEPPPA